MAARGSSSLVASIWDGDRQSSGEEASGGDEASICVLRCRLEMKKMPKQCIYCRGGKGGNACRDFVVSLRPSPTE
jgi:hypothetical protein